MTARLPKPAIQKVFIEKNGHRYYYLVGKPCSLETRIKISKAKTGKPCLLKTRKKISKANKGRYDSLTGSDCYNWKGGKFIDSQGYVRILAPDYPHLWLGNNRNLRYAKEHRLIMEQTLGRRILQEECIHHINGDKTDNRPENLKLIDRSNHQKLHLRTL